MRKIIFLLVVIAIIAVSAAVIVFAEEQQVVPQSEEPPVVLGTPEAETPPTAAPQQVPTQKSFKKDYVSRDDLEKHVKNEDRENPRPRTVIYNRQSHPTAPVYYYTTIKDTSGHKKVYRHLKTWGLASTSYVDAKIANSTTAKNPYRSEKNSIQGGKKNMDNMTFILWIIGIVVATMIILTIIIGIATTLIVLFTRNRETADTIAGSLNNGQNFDKVEIVAQNGSRIRAARGLAALPAAAVPVVPQGGAWLAGPFVIPAPGAAPIAVPAPVAPAIAAPAAPAAAPVAPAAAPAAPPVP